jgi:hypothetical protein
MAYLDCLRVSSRARRLRSKVLGFVTFAGVLCAPRAFLHAAPVTFRFDATVATGANLPFIVAPGDTITTTFTFQPGSSGPIYSQSNVIRFGVAGTILDLPEFQIRVANDERRWIDHPGRIADPNNTPDVDFNEIGDNIGASCLDGGPLFCGAVPGHSNFVFRPVLVFANENGLLSSNELLADPNVWNAFSLREMFLMFKNVDTGSTTYVGAYIGQIEQIPEPSTLRLLLGLLGIAAICFVVSRVLRDRAPLLRDARIRNS